MAGASSPPATAAQPVADRIWRRFSPGQRFARFTVYLVIVAAIVVSIQSVEVIPEFLTDAPAQTVDLFRRMWPFDWALYPKEVHAALIETLHIATLGTILAMFSKAVPVLVSVTVCAALGVLSCWLANVRVVADKLTAGAAAVVPLPVRLTVWGLPVALSVKVMVPGWLPVAVGVKVTVMVQLAPAATEVPQVLVWAYCALAVMLVMLRAPVPPLVSVTVCAALVVFTF